MSKLPTAVFVFAIVVLGVVSLAGTATALSVTVAEEGSDITIQVTEDGMPVDGAEVRVSGVTRETPLDGEYTTTRDGEVRFREARTEDLEGVVHLRITVDTGSSFRSVLTSVTRSPEEGPSPMGHRMSMSIQESVASTHGMVESRLDTSDAGEDDVRAQAEEVDRILEGLGDAEFEREVLGRDLAAGEISSSEFYLSAVENARKSSSLRSGMSVRVDYLSRYDDETLRESGVRVDELDELRQEIEGSRSVDTNRRIVGE